MSHLSIRILLCNYSTLFLAKHFNEEIRNAAPGVVSSGQSIGACTLYGVDGWERRLTAALAFTVHIIEQVAAADDRFRSVFFVRTEEASDGDADRESNEDQKGQSQNDQARNAIVQVQTFEDVSGFLVCRAMVIKRLDEREDLIPLLRGTG